MVNTVNKTPSGVFLVQKNMKREKEEWHNVDDEWKVLPADILDNIKKLYASNNWRIGRTFIIGKRIIKYFPELSEIKGTTYLWETGKYLDESWAVKK